jgi:hypothetical protein
MKTFEQKNQFIKQKNRFYKSGFLYISKLFYNSKKL